ncbi:AMP-binding protein [Actinospica sp. MGRD01-02]|uniref:AMP-binding protein n=1 Tax=Actinospica acidithermotolerans TaxID=2828514 RepID=A0A941E5W8_9ACTN|nr:AMP-binding protein [Actinospica acidithermotolerans]MBR7826925.1 AMP-binding protein [Actinospica acidithermotolerans]
MIGVTAGAAERALAPAGPARGPVDLTGPRARVPGRSLEEVVRPFEEAGRGITFLDGRDRRTLTYRELAGRAAAVAQRLGEFGVRPGDRVAANAGNDLDTVALLMGVWFAGAAFVSLPKPSRRDAGRFARDFGQLLKACDCAFAVTEDTESELAAFGGLKVIPAAALRGLEPLTRGVPDALIGDTALIQFTSGSVSMPKGVAIGSSTLAGHIDMLRRHYQLEPDHDRIVSWLPLYHDMGLIAAFLQALIARVDLVLMPPTSFAYGPATWLNTLAAERGTFTAAPDFAYRMAATVPYDSGLDLSGVRVSLCGGERVNPRTMRDFQTATEPLGLLPGALIPSYGLAENVVGVSSPTHGLGPRVGPGGHVPLGAPMPGVAVRAPEGPVPGPVLIRGAYLFDGYHTIDGFIPAARGGWHDTGDDGFIHDGELHVVGRRAEVASIAGRNVFAEDIEAVVRDTAGAAVGACAAFRLHSDDQRFGLMVEVPPSTARAGDGIGELGSGIRAAVRDALGVRVATVQVVRVGTIPRTTSGKVQRAHCRQLHAEGTLGRRLLAAID